MLKIAHRLSEMWKMPFEHLRFTRQWELPPEIIYKLGQCRALTKNLATVPLSPKTQSHLKQVALLKGAQATTAIEGNTLAEKEIRKIIKGQPLPESKAYQEQEVKNILRAMNRISETLFAGQTPAIITPELLLQYHHFVGKDLSEPFRATPGEFAQSQRTVGRYRCPPPGRGKNQVEELVKRLCDWLQTEFGFASGKQSFRDGIIQAVVTHIYIEWIHPFDDGNGRTGRLVEFYLLLRTGVPDICAHILSNHYNSTRPEYYAHISSCQHTSDLTPFIAYAITGFLDGLYEVWKTVDVELLNSAWRGYVYDKFAGIKWSKPVFKRRRRLLLDLPLLERYDLHSIQLASPEIAREYATVNISTVKRDIRELIETGLLIEHPEGREVEANIGALRGHYPESLQK